MKIAAIIAIASLTSSTCWAYDLQGRASVIDGDTVEIHGARIRLEGIDSPEGGQLCKRNEKQWICGGDAAFALAYRIGSAPILCRGAERDRYGRLLATCYLGRENLNEWMVRQGWAVAYRHYSTAYVGAEDDAKKARRGLWAGEFQMPWDWRADQRAGAGQ